MISQGSWHRQVLRSRIPTCWKQQSSVSSVKMIAVPDRKDEYGTYYRVTGTLQGPNGDLNVITVWIYGAKESNYRFITLKPDKE